MEQLPKRRALVGGNWKCKLTLAEAEKLVNEVYGNMAFDPAKVCKNCPSINIHLPYRGRLCPQFPTPWNRTERSRQKR